MELTVAEFEYLGKCLEGFFYGLYSGIFIMYLQYHASKKDTGKENKILFFALCLLYALSVITIVSDLATSLVSAQFETSSHLQNIFYIIVIQAISFACCDFISQFILIYRCWIVWDHNIRVVIVPSILAFAFLPIWIVPGVAPLHIVQGQPLAPDWSNMLTITGLAISMVVNALVMSLIILRIFKVFREVKTTSDEQILGPKAGGSTLRPIIFVLIESGMLLFSIQLVRLVTGILACWTDNVGADYAYPLIPGIHGMLNGITPTIILVRVSVGLSFHDENSMVEAAGGLRFAPADDLNPTGSTSIVDQNRKDDDLPLVGIEFRDDLDSDIQMVDRSEVDSVSSTI